jgi:hypothetical protein
MRDVSDDIVGSSLGMNGVRDRRDGGFSRRGPWVDESPQEAAIVRTMGGEQGQLARFVREAGQAAVPHLNVSTATRASG